MLYVYVVTCAWDQDEDLGHAIVTYGVYRSRHAAVLAIGRVGVDSRVTCDLNAWQALLGGQDHSLEYIKDRGGDDLGARFKTYTYHVTETPLEG